MYGMESSCPATFLINSIHTYSNIPFQSSSSDSRLKKNGMKARLNCANSVMVRLVYALYNSIAHLLFTFKLIENDIECHLIN